MSFYLEEVCELELDFDYRELAREVVECCLEKESFPYEAEVSLTLTDDSGIRELNRSCRGIDRATDVLSFPLLSYEAPGEFSFLLEEREEDFNPDTGEVMLGDIVISLERAEEQAREYGHTVKREYAFLIVHSMLHLFGYDHMEPEEAERMEKKQREILEALKIY